MLQKQSIYPIFPDRQCELLLPRLATLRTRHPRQTQKAFRLALRPLAAFAYIGKAPMVLLPRHMAVARVAWLIMTWHLSPPRMAPKPRMLLLIGTAVFRLPPSVLLTPGVSVLTPPIPMLPMFPMTAVSIPLSPLMVLLRLIVLRPSRVGIRRRMQPATVPLLQDSESALRLRLVLAPSYEVMILVGTRKAPFRLPLSMTGVPSCVPVRLVMPRVLGSVIGMLTALHATAMSLSRFGPVTVPVIALTMPLIPGDSLLWFLIVMKVRVPILHDVADGIVWLALRMNPLAMNASRVSPPDPVPSGMPPPMNGPILPTHLSVLPARRPVVSSLAIAPLMPQSMLRLSRSLEVSPLPLLPTPMAAPPMVVAIAPPSRLVARLVMSALLKAMFGVVPLRKH